MAMRVVSTEVKRLKGAFRKTGSKRPIVYQDYRAGPVTPRSGSSKQFNGRRIAIPPLIASVVQRTNGATVPTQRVRDSLYFFENDPNGAPVRAFDEAGNVVWEVRYGPTGKAEIIKSNVAVHLRMQGQYFDKESTLHYNRFRYFDPQTAQFISPDPIGVQGGLNAYEYAPNVFGWLDPMGLNRISAFLKRADGSTIELPEFKATPGAKKVIGRTEDAEQKLLRHLKDVAKRSDLEGSTLNIRSENSFIRRNGVTIPVEGINPWEDCARVMAEFAQEHKMKIKYHCKNSIFSY
ncbi:rhsD protein [Caballeronia pedi]|uniref:RhsD protein n=1 Tax=Caballeronia pedi TaxID=1777141 RepID=A0A158D7S8_9BURK|nr:RHS repeat-associated core domain-containing protein [Caballeronia pedi]SAK90658.1 rhsD protein [Caballeronia pedi]